MPKTCVIVSFVLLLTVSCMLPKAQALQRICGKTLSDTMNAICYKGFNVKPLKRSSLWNNTNEFDNNSLANDIISLNMSDSSKSLQYPGSTYSSHSRHHAAAPHALHLILSKLNNGMMLTQTRRQRQRRTPSPGGIYYECCLKGCSATEMNAYCL